MKPADPPSSLRIVVISGSPSPDTALQEGQRGRALSLALQETGHDIVAWLPPDADLGGHLSRLRPDLVAVDSPHAAREMLALVAAATQRAPCPVVLFTADASRASMEAALACGVSAYVVDGPCVERVRPVLELALVRFRRERRLLAELAEARQQLADRKLIDRAKGLLMARQKLSEEEAYARLRGMAMNRNLRLAELAQRILDVEDLLG